MSKQTMCSIIEISDLTIEISDLIIEISDLMTEIGECGYILYIRYRTFETDLNVAMLSINVWNERVGK